MNVFELVATLKLDSSQYEAGLAASKTGLDSFNSFTNKAFAAIKTAAVVALGAATAAVGKFVKSSIEDGKEFDSAMSQVVATMGTSMDEMLNQTGEVELAWGKFSGNLREYALEMGRNTAFSATEAAEALNYMALAGYDAQQSMEMLPNVLNLAAAGNIELGYASDMVTDTQKAFGLTAERTTLLVDEMAKAASTGNTSVEQLGEAFLRIGGLGREMNGGFIELANGVQQPVDGLEELAIMFTATADAGIKGSEAGTHVRNMLLKLVDPTDDARAILKMLGVDVFDAEGNMRSFRSILKDMSFVMSDDVVPAFKEYYDRISQIDAATIKKQYNTKAHADEYKFFGISVVDAAGNLRDFNDVLNEVQYTFENGLTQEQKLQAISTLFNTRDIASVEALLNSIDEDWDRIGESILSASEAGVVYRGKVYGIQEAQEKFGDAIYDTEQGFKMLGAAEFMAMTQLDNLEGDVTLFNSALEGTHIALYDGIKPVLREVVQAGTRGLSELAEKFDSANFQDKMQKIGEKVGKLADRVIDFLLNLDWDAILDGIASGIDKAANAVQFLMDNSDKIRPIIETVIGLLVAWKVIQLALNLAMLSNPISLVVVAIAALVAAGVLLYKNWDTVKEKAGQLWNKIKDSFSRIGTSIETAFKNAVNSAKNWGRDLVNNFKSGVTDKLTTLRTTLSNMAGTIRSYLHFSQPDEGPLSDFGTYAPDMMKEFAKGIENNQGIVDNQLSTVIQKIKNDQLNRVEDSFNQTGLNAMTVMSQGIASNAYLVQKQMGVSATQAKVMTEQVSMNQRLMLKDASVSMQTLSQITTQAAMKGNSSVSSIFQNLVRSTRSWGADMITNFRNGITSGLSSLMYSVKTMASTIRSYLHFSEPDVGPLSDFHTYAPDMMKLFAKGIAEGEHFVTDQLEKSFDFQPTLVPDSTTTTGVASNDKTNEIVLMIDGHELARFMAPAISSQLAFGRG